MTRTTILFSVVVLAAASAGAAQEHAPVAPGAKEAQAEKLHEDLGLGKKVLIIDVRDIKEFSEGHVPGAINIPAADLNKRLAEMKISKDTMIVTMCEHGGRSSHASLELEKLGYKTTSFCRLEEWKKAGYRTETTEKKSDTSSGKHTFTCHHYCQSEKEVADLAEKCDCTCDKAYRECMKEP